MSMTDNNQFGARTALDMTGSNPWTTKPPASTEGGGALNDVNRVGGNPPAIGSGSNPWTKPIGGTAEQNDAFASLQSLLTQYGLTSLAKWAWEQLLNNHSPAQILLELYNQPAFKERFPAIEARQKAGLPPISPGEYIAYESARAQILRAAGFPPGFYDHPDDATADITRNVSIAEVSQRASMYQQAAYQVPEETRRWMRAEFGIKEGDIAAFFADPDRALPLLEQQFTAAQIAGEASVQHFGSLSRSEAERLAALGVTDERAAQGFAQVAGARELFQQLPGEAGGGPGRAEALGVVAGDAAAVEAAGRQAAKRKAKFQEGGGYAGSQTGISGLGSAATT